MSVLFGRRRNKVAKTSNNADVAKVLTGEDKSAVEPISTSKAVSEDDDQLASFASLGLDAWMVKKCELLGLQTPTDIQRKTIPSILQGRDVLGCAQTGSGKTAAFALPILQDLSKDPYGPFALVLTPTRELAFQLADQFRAFGSAIGARVSVIVGGVDMLTQALELQNQPHVIIATPGRMHDHLMRPSAPNLSILKYLVLDEADRLLQQSFHEDLEYILNAVPDSSKRKTLLFSATMTANLEKLERLTDDQVVRVDVNASQGKLVKTVETLDQKYLFIPEKVKLVYLMYLLSLWSPSEELEQTKKSTKHKKVHAKKLEQLALSSSKKAAANGTSSGTNGKLVMVFVSTCAKCELLGEVARELNLSSLTLHSMMSQNRRLAALGKFKSGQSSILISTDVASRGLDIPEVDYVVNFDIPRDSDDYIHRVGRTARAGRQGQSVALVSQNDIELLQNVEKGIGKQLSNMEEEVEEEDVLKLLNDVTTAITVSRMRLRERGFEEQVEERRSKRRKQREKRKRDLSEP